MFVKVRENNLYLNLSLQMYAAIIKSHRLYLSKDMTFHIKKPKNGKHKTIFAMCAYAVHIKKHEFVFNNKIYTTNEITHCEIIALIQPLSY